MRYPIALFTVVLAVGLAGCGAGVELPPVAPEDVEIFMPGTFPPEDYRVLTQIREEVPLNVSDNELIERARARAARSGADALVIRALRRTTEGGADVSLQQEQLKILEGSAVYFPSRHPELQNQ